MLTAYFDESYNQPTLKEPDLPLVYTVAGYLSSSEQWTAFEKEWRKALSVADIPFFHMTDFESRVGVYKNWENDQRIEFLQTLHRIIHKYVLKGFATSIVIADYEKLTPFQKEWVFGEPHMAALFDCLKKIYKICEEIDIHQPIAYVFEKNQEYDSKIIQAFYDMPEDAKIGYRVGSLSFTEKDCGPVNAADILAYEVTKAKANQLKAEGQRRPERRSILNLAVSQIDEWFYMDSNEFEIALGHMKRLGTYDESMEDGYVTTPKAQPPRGKEFARFEEASRKKDVQ